MVYYSSMSPLPSSASMLYSTFASFCFYALSFFFLHTTPSIQLLFIILCSVLPLHSIHWASNLHFSYSPDSPPTHIHNYREKLTILSVLHDFLTSSPLPDHHSNSSSSLVVMLNLFIINERYSEILWFLWQSQLFVFSGSYSQSFWLLWLLSPFLYVTTDGGHMLIQKALRNLGLSEC
jgi:hypothetical protein